MEREKKDGIDEKKELKPDLAWCKHLPAKANDGRAIALKVQQDHTPPYHTAM